MIFCEGPCEEQQEKLTEQTNFPPTDVNKQMPRVVTLPITNGTLPGWHTTFYSIWQRTIGDVAYDQSILSN